MTEAMAMVHVDRICKEHGYADHVWNLALLASPQERLDAARYFEAGGGGEDFHTIIPSG
jgi:hypothetical protein